MKSSGTSILNCAVALIGVLLVCSPVYGDKDKSSHGKGHGGSDKHDSHSHDYGDNHDRDDDDGHHSGESHYFTDQHRVIVHQYYVDEFNHGRCPPGLAKKHNGCRPPGLAKQWVIGQPLPREVIYYPLPQTVIVNLGAPPPGAQYVRVANDILLIAAGSGMVLDALADLSGM